MGKSAVSRFDPETLSSTRPESGTPQTSLSPCGQSTSCPVLELYIACDSSLGADTSRQAQPRYISELIQRLSRWGGLIRSNPRLSFKLSMSAVSRVTLAGAHGGDRQQLATRERNFHEKRR